MNDRVAIAAIRRLGAGPSRTDQDLLAVEAPLTLEIEWPAHGLTRTLGVMMRTPGDDRDLALGWLHAEGVIRAAADVASMQASPASGDARDAGAVLRVVLAPHVDADRAGLDRAGDRAVISSACGLCGRLELHALDRRAAADRANNADVTIAASTISRLPAVLRNGQTVFAETGGLHAAALCDTAGGLRLLREDVGRHNAVDKAVGAALDAGLVPGAPLLLVVSGRVAFEIVQKAAMAGLAAIVAVGAPSSLAVEAARATGLTLIGFARDGRFNVYTGEARLRDDAGAVLQ